MTLHLIYFAALRDLMGISEETITWASDGLSTDALITQLKQQRPKLDMGGVRLAVNEEFVNDNFLLSDGDVVAFIPPVSGG